MRFSLDSFGCTMNHGEAELLRRRLVHAGNIQTPPEGAELNILLTCVVIQETERRMVKKIRELKKLDKPIVISGCLVTTFPERIREIAPRAILIPPREIDGISVESLQNWVVSEKTKPFDINFTTVESGDRRVMNDIFCSPEPGNLDRCTFIVPISQGCLGNCAYCITRKARGLLKSYPPWDIVDLVIGAVDNGGREIQLTSQDTGIYGRDIGLSLPSLLQRLTAIHGDFRMRVGMMNPTGMKSILKELIDAFSSEKVFKFLHMPIQSGDNTILRKMNRGYLIEEAVDILEKFRNSFPDLTFSTDIITGYPGEDESSFGETLRIVEEMQPDLVNITRFSERPGTPAERLDGKVHGRISKERSREMTKLRFRISSEKNARQVGKTMRVLVTERGKGNGKESSVICRDDNYRSVVVKQNFPVGERFNVRIVDSTNVYILGELI